MPREKNKKRGSTGSPTPTPGRSPDNPPAVGGGKSLRPKRIKAQAARDFIRSTLEPEGDGSPLTGKAPLMGKRKKPGKEERGAIGSSPYHSTTEKERIGLSQCHKSTA